MQHETVCRRCAEIYRLTFLPGGMYVMSCRCPPTPVIVTSGTSYEPSEAEIRVLDAALASYGVHVATPSMRDILTTIANARRTP